MDIGQLLKEIVTLMLYAAIVPLGMGLYCWPSLNRPLRLFWLNVGAGLLISIISEYLRGKQVDYTFIFYVNTAIDGVLLTGFFTAYMATPAYRRIFTGLCGLLLLFMGWAIWFWGSSLTTVFRLSSVESCLILVMAIVVLTETVRHNGPVSLRRQPVVYLAVGLIAANFLTLVLNLFGTQLYTYSIPLFNLFWNTIAPLSNLLLYLFTCVAFWQSRFQPAQPGYSSGGLVQ